MTTLANILAYEQPRVIVLKETIYNVEALNVISHLNPILAGYSDIPDAIYKDEITKAKRMMQYYKRKDNSNTFEYLKKNYEVGRFYPDSSKKNMYGYQSIYNKLRKLLMAGKYLDVDMINAQPTIMTQIAGMYNLDSSYIQEYISNRSKHLLDVMTAFGCSRDVAKNFFIVTLFGGTKVTWYSNNNISATDKLTPFQGYFEANMQQILVGMSKVPEYMHYVKIQSLIKGKKGQRANVGAMGLFLQDIESKILTVMFREITGADFKVATLIHDGLLVYKDARFDDAFKTQVEAKITEVLGLHIKLDFKVTDADEEIMAWYERHKPFSSVCTIQKADQRTDELHASLFLEMFKDKCYRTAKGLMVYEASRGVWTSQEADHRRIIGDISADVLVNVHEGDEKKTFDRLFTPAYKIIKDRSPLMKDWDNHTYDIGFLCFRNGVLDMQSFELYPLSPHYRFEVAIDRDYDVEVDYSGRIQEIMDRLFNKQFTNEEKKVYFLEKLSRCFGGCASVMDRQFMYLIGDTACGKGKLTHLFRNSFEGYVVPFDADNILTNSGNSGDSAKDMKFVIPFCNARMAISNEVTLRAESDVTSFGVGKKLVKINAGLLKRLISEGDALTVRRLFENEITIVNKAGLCIFVNDAPPVSAVDAAYLSRANYITFDRSSDPSIVVDDEFNFVADASIQAFVSDIEVADAFIALMCSHYATSVDNGLLSRPECVAHQSRELSGAGEANEEWFKNNYRFYADEMNLTVKDSLVKLDGCVDWEKADGWFMQFDTLYDFYMKSGNTVSKTKLGSMFKKMSLVCAVKKIKGRSCRVIIGIAPPRKEGASGRHSFLDDAF
jgi:hypothetical protein